MENFVKFTTKLEPAGVYKKLKAGDEVKSALLKDVSIARVPAKHPFYRIYYRGGDLLVRLASMDAKKIGGDELNVDKLWWDTRGIPARDGGEATNGGRIRIKQPLDPKAAKQGWIDEYGTSVLDGLISLLTPMLHDVLKAEFPDDEKYKDDEWLREHIGQGSFYEGSVGGPNEGQLMLAMYCGADTKVYGVDDAECKFDKTWTELQSKTIMNGIGALPSSSSPSPGQKRDHRAAFESESYSPALLAPIVRIGGFSFYNVKGELRCNLAINLHQVFVAPVHDHSVYAPKAINPSIMTVGQKENRHAFGSARGIPAARPKIVMDDDDDE